MESYLKMNFYSSLREEIKANHILAIEIKLDFVTDLILISFFSPSFSHQLFNKTTMHVTRKAWFRAHIISITRLT